MCEIQEALRELREYGKGRPEGRSLTKVDKCHLGMFCDDEIDAICAYYHSKIKQGVDSYKNMHNRARPGGRN